MSGEVWLAVAILVVGSALACAINWLVRPRWMRNWHVLLTVAALLVVSSGLVMWSSGLQANSNRTAVTPGSSQWTCESTGPDATLRAWPSSAEVGVRVVFAGDGFPPNTAIEIDLLDRRPNRSGKIYDVGGVRSDACGKFDFTWTVPASLLEEGHRSVGVGAATTAPAHDPASSCCHAEATLEIIAPT